MAFHDAIFPVPYSRNAQVGPRVSASAVFTPGGRRQVVQNWDEPLRQWTVAKRVKTVDEIYQLYVYWLERDGTVNTFPFLDPLDNALADVPTEPSAGDGVTVDFQIVKRYGDFTPRVRTIVLPVLDSVEVTRDGVPAPAADYSVDRGTGIITFNSAPAGGVAIAASCKFHARAYFGSEAAIFDLESLRLGSWNGIEILEDR